jgi:diamine N-acetyltransferase
MIPPGSRAPLHYRTVSRADTSVLSKISLDPEVLERFLGSLEAVAKAVREGVAHVLVVSEHEGQTVGFYVTHPDPRDSSIWWLAYLAVSSRVQGLGIGRAMVARALQSLSSVPSCRRVLLLVDRENSGAHHLYSQMGFEPSGEGSQGTEDVLAWTCAAGTPALAPTRRPQTLSPTRRRLRVRLNPGPHAARVIGSTRGPPRHRTQL